MSKYSIWLIWMGKNLNRWDFFMAQGILLPKLFGWIMKKASISTILVITICLVEEFILLKNHNIRTPIDREKLPSELLYMVCFLSCSHLWHFHFLLISVGYDLNLMIKASTCLYTPTINANSRNWSLMISRKESPGTARKILKISNHLINFQK